MYLAWPDPKCAIPGYSWYCAYKAAKGTGEAADTAFDLLGMIGSIFTDPFGGGFKNFLIWTFEWLLTPTSNLLDTSDDSVSATIQSKWILPIVAVFLTCGILWQGFQMVISRKGTPLIRVVKAILMTAAAGGVATAGSAALLTAGDKFSCWVLGEALRGPNTNNPNLLISSDGSCADNDAVEAVVNSQVVDRLVDILTIPAALASVSGIGLILFPLIALIVLISALLQIFLLVIRGGSLVILVGMSQLAAAGSITRATSAWPMKLVGWMLALIFYKPAAAMVYATALLLIDDAGGDSKAEVSNFIMGLTMLLLALFAMPALMRFFTWGFSGLGRDGTLDKAATGADNLGDDAIRIGQWKASRASSQAKSIDSSLPAGASGSAAATGTSAASGAASGTGAAAGGGTVAAGAAAAPATAGVSLIIAGTIVGATAAATQIGASLKRATTNVMDEDNS